jgi:hypothetical protein
MNPNPSYTVASETSFGPYFYLNLDLLFDMTINNTNYGSFLFSLIGESSKLKYMAAGFNDTTGEWADVEEEVHNKTLALEISMLINLVGTGVKLQIGYGRTFDETTGGANYMLLGARKEWF